MPRSAPIRSASSWRSIVVVPGKHDLGTVRPRAVHLHGGGCRRHHDHSGDAEQTGRARHRLTVIARRIRDDAAVQCVTIELAEHVGGAANLECSRELQVLTLQPETCAIRVRRRGQERCSPRDTSDSRGGRGNVVERYERACAGSERHRAAPECVSGMPNSPDPRAIPPTAAGRC